MTDAQMSKLNYLLVDLALVLDRIYYDHKKESVNFRSHWKWELIHQRPYFTSNEQQRMAILADGEIVNRNEHRKFVGVKP